MQRTTIDIGIDLGTTNSAVAVLEGVTPRILKNNDDHDVTPSAVGYGKNGQTIVGHRAKGLIIDKPNDAYLEFKRRMGTEFSYQFKASGLAKKPEELSAEVLKSLRADAERALGEEFQAAVITVPAAFELHQCDATRKAAELAGFGLSALLQEPVAAALAYGFQSDAEKAYWLVYDFGGGTFDAALIKAEEGIINVVHHGGDNFLGGADIDWAIIEELIIPRLSSQYDLPDFKRGSSKWSRELLKIKRAVEMAKIELTSREKAMLVDCSFEDISGEEIDCEDIELSRSDIATIAEPFIAKSVEICKKVLAEKSLAIGDLSKIILVGGPTKAPYFRSLLKDRFGDNVDHSADPLTVVSKGAAVFAGTQRLDSKLMRKAKIGEFQVELKYKPIGHENDPVIAGRVVSPSGDSISGFTIEFVNQASKWRSGRVPLRTDGAFMANLLAEKGTRNTFSIELLDSTGTKQVAIPESLVYTIGAVVEEQPLIHSMGVALAGNEYEKFFEKGIGLPVKKKGKNPFRTTKALKVGESGACITIPVIEGENEVADRNRLIGVFEISSEMIRRDLPAGSEFEVTLKIDESRIITVFAYVPVLDEEFTHQFDLRKQVIDQKRIEKDYENETKRINDLIQKVEENDDEQASEKLSNIKSSKLVAEIKRELSAAKGDPDAAEKADKRLLELKLLLDKIEDEVQWPSLVLEAKDWLGRLETLANQHANDDQDSKCRAMKQETMNIIESQQKERLPRKLKQLQDLYYDILFSLSAFWVNQFTNLQGRISQMSDQSEAARLIKLGQGYLEQDNIGGIRNVVFKLWDLLPREVVEEVQRGYGSTITH